MVKYAWIAISFTLLGGNKRFVQTLSQHGLESRHAISGSDSKLGHMFPQVSLTSACKSNASTTLRKSVLPNVGRCGRIREGRRC